jgi:hypothetical protein
MARMTTLVQFGADIDGPTITLGPDVQRVEIRPDLSVRVVGNVPKLAGAKFPRCVLSEADGTATLTDVWGRRHEVLTARAYLLAAERQGIPVETVTT